MSPDPLETAVNRLVNRVSHWTPPRWAASSASGSGSGPAEPSVTRAEVLHALVQRLADLGADAEKRPRQLVPRLEHDASLVDQVKVVAADLSRVGDDHTLAEAATLLETVNRAL